MKRMLVRNGTLIDGNGGAPIENAALLIEGNRVTQAGPSESISSPDEETEVMDAQGGYILPGFIDCHVHVVLENLTIERVLATPLSFTLFQSIDHMHRTLEAGVTSVRDAGGADLGLKQAVEEGLVEGPRMQISITILSITGGHLDYFMPSGNEYTLFTAYPGRPAGICDGVEEVRKKVRELLRAGAEIIKVCTTGGTMSPRDHPTFTQFSPAELAVMVEEAAFHGGKKVMAHAQGSEGIKNAVRAGAHSIEHGVYLDDEAIELMLGHDTFLVPTLSAPAFILERCAESDAYPEWGVRKVREVFDVNLESIARAYQAGVRIAMGTDACVGPHGANLRELSLMCQIGMSPMESIVASTRVAAECLGWEDQVGTLDPGKLADVVVTKVDPLADIDSLTDNDNIQVVIKDGEVIKDLRPAKVRELEPVPLLSLRPDSPEADHSPEVVDHDGVQADTDGQIQEIREAEGRCGEVT